MNCRNGAQAMPGSSIDTSIALSVSTMSDLASPLPQGHSN
jgi:hypothetical protein